MAEYLPNAVLAERHDINDELAVFRIKPESGEVPSFTPGQYAELAIPEVHAATGDEAAPAGKLLRRSYSIASAPDDKRGLEFYIVRVDGGELTPKLWSLQQGERLWVGPKVKGKFTLENVPPGSDVVMVATGTGLAPFLSMLRHHRAAPPWRRAVLLHGARFQRDLGYVEELKALQEEEPWFHYLTTLTREPEGSDWTGNRGRIQHLFTGGALANALGEAPNVERTHFLLCGNPQMIDDLEVLLAGFGLRPHKKKEPGNIHVERYW